MERENPVHQVSRSKQLSPPDLSLHLPVLLGTGTPQGTPQSFLLPWAGLLVRSFPEPGRARVDTVGDSSFTLSRRVFLRAAGETFS